MIWRACPLQRDGWRFQLLLQRRAADGEWEIVDESVRDSPTGAMLAMIEPFLSSERQMRVRHGLSDVPVVSYEGDLYDFDMFDGGWRAGVDCGQPAPHASEYHISGMLIAFDGKTVWETVCAGLDLLDRE